MGNYILQFLKLFLFRSSKRNIPKQSELNLCVWVCVCAHINAWFKVSELWMWMYSPKRKCPPLLNYYRSIQRGAPGVVRAGRMGPRPGPKFWASKPSLPFVSAKQMPHFLNFQKTIFLLHCNAPAIGSGHWMWEWPSPALNVGVTFPWLFLKPVLSEAGKSHPLYVKDKGKSFLKVRLDLSVRQKPNSSFLFLAARCPSLLIMLPETLLCNQWGRN